MAVVALLFVQEVAAQGVSTVLRDMEKRQSLYFSIINNDERFIEFPEAVKASGRAKEGATALDTKKQEGSNVSIVAAKETVEEKLAIEQMVSLMREILAENPDLQKVIDEKYPGVGNLMKKDGQKL